MASILSGRDDASIAKTCASIALSPSEFIALRDHASAAKAAAYCPYSRFRVGAALLPEQSPSSDASISGSGSEKPPTVVVTGANVENASYPVGTCAERVALGTAVVGGWRTFRALAVATDVSPPASPCGMCRQFIREFCGLDMPVIMFDKNGDYVVMTLGELLPMSFGPDQLPPLEAMGA